MHKAKYIDLTAPVWLDPWQRGADAEIPWERAAEYYAELSRGGARLLSMRVL